MTGLAVSRPLVLILLSLLLVSPTYAQQGFSRLKGRTVTERGEPVKDAEVRAEAFFGAGAGTFAGQRTFSARTNAKGEWTILGITSGIWLFEVVAPGYTPEITALPIRLLTASGPNAGGQMLLFELVLKPEALRSDEQGQILAQSLEAALANKGDVVRTRFGVLPDEADADFLAAAGRVSVLARQMDLASGLFRRAIERDPSSYRAALGIASVFLLNRDFDNASRAFDAARNRTHDKDEQKFITAAIGDLATIKVR
ncbi:MAG TPA: hypothetical protein VGH34_09485 [Vicinamibacterales bacterium]